MRLPRLAALLFAALSPCLVPWPAVAQTPRVPVLRAALPPVEGEVIVGFKSEADTLRKHALAAKADAGAVQQVLAQRTSSLGQRVGRTLQAGAAVGERAMVMRATGVDAITLARQLAADPDVAYAVPNGRKRIVVAPNDPLYPATATGVRANGPDSGQWYLRAPDTTLKSAINAEAAWARTTGSAGVVVAVLDTGVRYDHPDLAARLLPGYDFVTDTDVSNDGDGRDADASDPGDWVSAAEARTTKFASCGQSNSSWHGTSTASLVGAAGNNGVGMSGTAPGVRLLPVRVLGKCFGSDGDIQAGMRWAAGIHVDGVPDNPTPARVINMSLGSDCAAGQSCTCNAAYRAVIAEVTAAGAVVVVAGGNSIGGPVGEPGNCVGVVTVAALRHAGTKVGYSDLGPEIALAAPGGNCVNTATNSPCLYPVLAASNSGTTTPALSTYFDSYTFEYGTSFSAPLVAGVAALMLSRNASFTPAQLRSTLQATARAFPTSGAETPGETVPVCRAPVAGVEQVQCYCTTALCGAGMLDAAAAVAAVSTSNFVSVTYNPVSPLAGSVVSFSITGLQTQQGSAVQSYAWTLVDGGGAANGFSTATNASTAALTPTAAGTLRIRLTVTDAQGSSSSTEQSVVVPAAAAVTPPPPTASSGGGGGGAASGAWVAGVGLAAAVLWLLRRRPRGLRAASGP